MGETSVPTQSLVLKNAKRLVNLVVKKDEKRQFRNLPHFGTRAMLVW